MCIRDRILSVSPTLLAFDKSGPLVRVFLCLDNESAADEQLMLRLGGALNLPGALLALRAAEALAKENLRALEDRIQAEIAG